MNIINNMFEAMLLDKWKSLGLPEQIGVDLLKKYNEPHRHYHGIKHLHDCYIKFETHQYLIKDKLAIQLAIWFHDCIYNPMSKINEESSANYYASVMNDDTVVTDMILSTINHIPLTKNQDLLYFLDIDLSILGSSKLAFRQYEENIRKEYSHVSEEDYCKGRTQILQKFLEREHLYYTKEFRAKFEKKARKNINSLLEYLRR